MAPRSSSLLLLSVALVACGKSAERPTATAASATAPSSASATAPASPASPSLSSGAASGGPACPASPAVADVRVEASTIAGFGAPAETLFLDGNRATLLVRETGDVGQVVGAFEACAREDVVRSLEGLVTRAAAAKEPRAMDGAMVSVTWRSGSRSVSAATNAPPSSPAGTALVQAVTDLSAAARANLRAGVRLDLVAPKDAAAGKPTRYVVRIVNAGPAPVTVALPAGGPWLEATALPLENAMWEPLGEKLGPLARTPIAAGAAVDLPVTVIPKEKKNLAVLARFAGMIELGGVPHAEGAFPTRIASALADVSVR